jgi:hypothetical protein
MILEGHEPWKSGQSDENGPPINSKYVSSFSYFPDGKQMISRSSDKAIRRWDLLKGKETEGAWEVCEDAMGAVGVSKNG